VRAKKRDVKDLTTDPANVRRHSRRNIDAIKASLKRFGQVKPIVVDSKGVVRAGNGTLQAAVDLGWSEVWVIETKLDGAEATAYAIADNRTGELAEWDLESLGKTLVALNEDGGLAGTGYDGETLEVLVRQMLEARDPDDQPAIEPHNIDEIGGYDDSKDTYSLRVDGIAQDRKDEVEARVRITLDALASEHGAKYPHIVF